MAHIFCAIGKRPNDTNAEGLVSLFIEMNCIGWWSVGKPAKSFSLFPALCETCPLQGN